VSPGASGNTLTPGDTYHLKRSPEESTWVSHAESS
jgi:hypothetical protein